MTTDPDQEGRITKAGDVTLGRASTRTDAVTSINDILERTPAGEVEDGLLLPPLEFGEDGGITLGAVEVISHDAYFELFLAIQFTGASWSISDGDVGNSDLQQLGVQLAGVDILVTEEDDNVSLAVTLRGSLTLAGRTLDITVDWPAGIFQARYQRNGQAPETGDSQRSFISGLGLPAGDHANGDKLSLEALALGIVWQNSYKQFTVSVAVAHLLKLPKFEVELFQAEVNYARFDGPAGQQTRTLARIWAEIEIKPGKGDPLLVLLMAERESASFKPAEGTGTEPEAAQGVSDSVNWRFAGSLATENLVLAAFVEDLCGIFDVEGASALLPSFLSSEFIERLDVAFSTVDSNFTFGLTIDFPDLDQAVLAIDLAFKSSGSGESATYERQMSGRLLVDGLQFEVDFESSGGAQQASSDLLVVTLKDTGRKLTLMRLISALMGEQAPAAPALDVDIEYAFFSYLSVTEGGDGSQAQSAKLLGLGLEADLNLAALPLVGQLAGDGAGGIGRLHLVYLSAAQGSPGLAANRVAQINAHLEQAGVTRLPENAGAAADQTALAAGFSITAELQLNLMDNTPVGYPALPAPGSTSGPAQRHWPADFKDGKQPLAATPPADDATWFAIQKSLGPLFFDRVGLRYDNGQLWFLLDAALTAGGLTLSLDGLGVSSPLDKFDPTFHLRGLGVDFREGPLEIGGAFERWEVKDPSDPSNNYDEYVGLVTVKTSFLSLSAMGAYAKLPNGDNSLFIYGILDYPLGGPPFFFVTGLAAGFGYNRAFLTPPIDQIEGFALVKEAMKVQEPKAEVSATANMAQVKQGLTEELSNLEQYLPAMHGQHFLAIGVRFTSFEMVNSFALVVVTFGEFSVRLLGQTNITVPTPPPGESLPEGEEPLAVVNMVFSAGFVPKTGELYLEAQLTNDSYILSKDCHITGGFAFYSWFKDAPQQPGYQAGDFVITLGGYHPDFKPKPWYPVVPRLGLNWEMDVSGNKLVIKADAYFALTGQALMAGGHMSATWDADGIHAWFIVGGDFLIAWQPYHYELALGIEVGAKVKLGLIDLSFSAGADLELWGPEFAGKARVHYGPVTFHVSFGDDTPAPKPLSWGKFRDAFLPADSLSTVSVTSGLVKALEGQAYKNVNGKWKLEEQEGATHWIVNGHDVCVEASSLIPITSAPGLKDKDGQGIDIKTPAGLGIAAMGISHKEWAAKGTTSEFTIKIERIKDNQLEVLTGDFYFDEAPPPPPATDTEKPRLLPAAAVRKNVPAAMWGAAKEPGKPLIPNKEDLNEQGLVADAPVGFRMKPCPDKEAPPSRQIAVDKLTQDTPDEASFNFQWSDRPLAAGGAEITPQPKYAAQLSLLQWLLPGQAESELGELVNPADLVGALRHGPAADQFKAK